MRYHMTPQSMLNAYFQHDVPLLKQLLFQRLCHGVNGNLISQWQAIVSEDAPIDFKLHCVNRVSKNGAAKPRPFQFGFCLNLNRIYETSFRHICAGFFCMGA
jgi:hypothetical protein